MSDDEEIALPSDTLAILQSFMAEKEESERKFAELQRKAEQDFDLRVEIDAFEEDYQMSQFWYDDETQEKLAREATATCPKGSIGFLSTPSAYFKAKSLKAEEGWEWSSTLFEFDTRFKVGAGQEFVHYDYSQPGALPERLEKSFDLLVIDPPFLSEECWLKFAIAIKKLAKPDGAKLIVCTGSVMREFLQRILPDLRVAKFKPAHRDSRLSNDFLCYVNYTSTNPEFEFE